MSAGHTEKKGMNSHYAITGEGKPEREGNPAVLLRWTSSELQGDAFGHHLTVLSRTTPAWPPLMSGKHVALRRWPLSQRWVIYFGYLSPPKFLVEL